MGSGLYFRDPCNGKFRENIQTLFFGKRSGLFIHGRCIKVVYTFYRKISGCDHDLTNFSCRNLWNISYGQYSLYRFFNP